MKEILQPACSPHDHPNADKLPIDEQSVERCARIFRALGDPARLRLIARLAQGAFCVGELATVEQETVATISQRLRVLRSDNIVRRKRDGKHVLYSLADQHMFDLVANGLAHASESAAHSTKNPEASSASAYFERNTIMATAHVIHENHTHAHGVECGHTTIEHDTHVDFLHDGHMHHPHEGHVDEHRLEVSSKNPDTCTEGHACNGHDAQHVHGAACGHEAVPHGDHTDYLVAGHLHHPHNGHCDNHGNVNAGL